MTKEKKQKKPSSNGKAKTRGKFYLLARSYLDLQHLRIAVEHRIRKIKESGFDLEENKPILEVLEVLARELRLEEKRVLEEAKRFIRDHPIWSYCQRVKGMGDVAALTFLGFIDPYVADTAGKARAYFGLVPEAELRSGSKARFNPEGKGRVWLVVRNVIMQRDPYYYPLYQKKKAYYMERMGAYINNPQLCPNYEECKRRIMSKARRLGRPPKKFPCKAHIDNKAKRWLAGLIVSHATQILREAEGLDVSNFKKHRGYIPPP